MYLINLYLYLFVYQLCLYFFMFILTCSLVNGTFCNEKWLILYPVVSFLPVNGSEGIWNEWMNELLWIFLILTFFKFFHCCGVKFYVILSHIVGGVSSSGICCCIVCFWRYSCIMLLLVFSFYVCFLLSSWIC
jgi:hypothetical protein